MKSIMKITIKFKWTTTGQYENKWYLELASFPVEINPIATITKTKNGFVWLVDLWSGDPTISGTTRSLASAKRVVQRTIKEGWLNDPR